MANVVIRYRVSTGELDGSANPTAVSEADMIEGDIANLFAAVTLDVAQNLLDLQLDQTNGPMLHCDGATVRQATALEISTTFPDARDADDLALEKHVLKDDTGISCRQKRVIREVTRLAVNQALPPGNQIGKAAMKTIWDDAVDALT